jgi:hypothetical protein
MLLKKEGQKLLKSGVKVHLILLLK